MSKLRPGVSVWYDECCTNEGARFTLRACDGEHEVLLEFTDDELMEHNFETQSLVHKHVNPVDWFVAQEAIELAEYKHAELEELMGQLKDVMQQIESHIGHTERTNE